MMNQLLIGMIMISIRLNIIQMDLRKRSNPKINLNNLRNLKRRKKNQNLCQPRKLRHLNLHQLLLRRSKQPKNKKHQKQMQQKNLQNHHMQNKKLTCAKRTSNNRSKNLNRKEKLNLRNGKKNQKRTSKKWKLQKKLRTSSTRQLGPPTSNRLT